MSDQLIRPQVGLMLSCGEPPTTARGYPKKLDYMRPKPGALGQYKEAADKFTEVFGDRPRVVDVLFVSDVIAENLEVRPLVFGTSGLKARGTENLAAYPPDQFGDKIRSFDWDLITYPDDQPGPGSYTVNGREDKVVTKLGLKVVGTLYVSIPSVLGLMMVAAVTTTSARTMGNWYDAIHRAYRLTGGVLVGIPFKLMLRPARGRYFEYTDKDDKSKGGKKKVTEFQEWILDSHHTHGELYEIAAQRRQAIGGGPPMIALPPAPTTQADRSEQKAIEAAEVPFVPVESFEEMTDVVDAVPVEDGDQETQEAEASLFQAPASVRGDR